MSEYTIAGYVPRGLLSRWLRQLRTLRGMHVDAAAAQIGVVRATLWRMEKGDNRCRYRAANVARLGRLYGADRGTEQRWADIAGRALDELSSRRLILRAAQRFQS